MTAAYDVLSQLCIRPLTQEDVAFIYHSWLKSYRGSNAHALSIEPSIYFARHHDLIERILNRNSTLVTVASPRDDEAVILGYLVMERLREEDIIHFCYVKESFRRLGVARALIETADIDLENCVHTHRVSDFEWVKKYLPGIVYDPYLQ